jgi:hypothetical protein
MKRDKSNGKSRLYWAVHARRELKQEHFMSHREMHAYWEEPKAALYGPLRLWSRWQAFKRRAPGKGLA